jgi:hypothetical protein
MAKRLLTTNTSIPTNNTPICIKVRFAMSALGNRLRLTFYNASDAPTIVLFGPIDADVIALQEVFRKLSAGESLKLDQQAFVVPFGGISLTAICTGSIIDGPRQGHTQGLRRLSQDSPLFEWRRTAEGWDYLAELIDSMCTSRSPGHQYLTAYPRDDAIVVVSRGEYSDDIVDV